MIKTRRETDQVCTIGSRQMIWCYGFSISFGGAGDWRGEVTDKYGNLLRISGEAAKMAARYLLTGI